MRHNRYLKLILGAVLLLSSGASSLSAQVKPGNTTETVELWLKADAGVTPATNGSSVTNWADQSGNARSHTASVNFPTYNSSTFLMNFQPSIDFRGGANQKLVGPPHFLNAARSYTVIYVSQQSNSVATFQTVYAFNSTRNNNFGWHDNGRPTAQIAGTAAVNIHSHQGNGRLYGINAVTMPNMTASDSTRVISYMNAVENGTDFTGTMVLAVTTGDGVIGSSTSANTGLLPFNGNIQEIIVLSGLRGEYIPSTELEKINSYLAIKYGITLEEGSYVDSDGAVVWSRSDNYDYTSNIFGIGRDDNTGLYQVQSQSMETDFITIYKGTLATLNSANTTFGSGFASDKTFVILGSNGLTGYKNVAVAHTNDIFASGPISGSMNVQSNIVYKAQVTGGAQTVNIDVSDPTALYVLVSSREDFRHNATYVYDITSQTALNVVINNGDYVTLGYDMAGSAPIGMLNSSFVTWLTPSSYSAGTWTNHITTSGTTGNFTSQQTAASTSSEGYGFYPALLFNTNGSNRFLSTNGITVAPSESFTNIFVYRRGVGPNTAPAQYDHILGMAAQDRWNALAFRNAAADNTIHNSWGSNDHRALSNAKEGFLIVTNPNNTNGTRFYLNGTRTNAPSLQWNGSTNRGTGRVAIGTSLNTGTSSWTYGGLIQEFIQIQNPANGYIDPIDLQKIHSYIFVKYNIPLLNYDDDYINSVGEKIWDKSVNAGYNNNIFGIGRDDASRLYQVQGRSGKSDFLTLHTGALVQYNDQNATFGSAFPADRTYVMIGSDNTSTSGYTQLLEEEPVQSYIGGGSFPAGMLNVRTAASFKVQVTGGGGTQTVNITTSDNRVQYVLVSPEPDFDPAYTHIYAITAQTANNVVLNDGEYITFVMYMPLSDSPFGAINTSGIVAWLTPDTYDGAGTWTNKITTNGIGNFMHQQTAPRKTDLGGYNFHPVVRFAKTNDAWAPNRLYSQEQSNITASDNVTTIFVYQRTNSRPANALIGFGNSAVGGTGRGLWFATANNNTLTSGWNGTSRAIGRVENGILTVDNPNRAGDQLNVYNNGLKTSFAGQQWNGTTDNSPNGSRFVALASIRNNANSTSGQGFQGIMQEVIMIRQPGNGNINALDLQKIHSYLAIKYGMHLENDDNYVDSKGQAVWGRDPNYNRNIFGIGRDDMTSLYQKQSVSTHSASGLAVYLGGTLASLNSQNAGTLEDMQYLMFAAHTTDPDMSRMTEALLFNDGTNFGTDPAPVGILFDAQSCRYKTVLSNDSAMTVTISFHSPIYTHVVLCKNDAFDDKTNMKLYELTEGVATVEFDHDYRYFMFIGFEKGPGGRKDGLMLWLKSNDISALKVHHTASTDPTIAGTALGNHFTDPDAVPTVDVWSDLMRDNRGSHTWEYTNVPPMSGTPSVADYAGMRRPIYTESHRLLNYKPGVRFWGNPPTTGDAGIAAYLRNLQPMTDNMAKHTSFFIMNADFSGSDRVYQMGFRPNSVIPNSSVSGYAQWGPAVGVIRQGAAGSTIGRGRYRGEGTEVNGNQNIFVTGNTTITSYYINTTNPNAGITYRFNGQQEFRASTSAGNLNRPSTIGGAIGRDRCLNGYMSEVIMYRGIITEEVDGVEKQRAIESYLALKYGITLRPANNPNQRFDYKFSDGSSIWNGETGPQRYADYYYRIASVIRDDHADLDNRHSISTATGSILHLGIAGEYLDINGNVSVGTMENDLEAVTFGDNNLEGTTVVLEEECGPIDNRFNRIWLLHKKTKNNNQPVHVLIGGQDNRGFNIGNLATPGEIAYMNILSNKSNELYLLVADTEDDIKGNTYKQVIPMTHLNGLWQCNYTFTEEDIYVTFGYRLNTSGCYDEDVAFTDAKKFDWKAWTNAAANLSQVSNGRTYTQNNGGAGTDLGDGAVVTQTQVIYPNTVRTYRYFPRVNTQPAAGSLSVRRYNMGAAPGAEMEIKITFEKSVIPEFSISGIDMTGSRNSAEIIEILGNCPDVSNISPLITPAAANTRLRINGNRVEPKERGGGAASDKRNMVYVEFESGVTEIIIKYKTTYYLPRDRSIFISPITIRAVPPPPPINEDGISFVKQVNMSELTTCEPVEYSFFIENINCNETYVQFLDTLPAGLIWDEKSLALDSTNTLYNERININEYAKSNLLQIDNLVIPGTSTIRFRATAIFEDNAPSGTYNNRAAISYDAIEYSIPITKELLSLDRQTLEEYTSLLAEQQVRHQKVDVVVVAPHSYREKDAIEITYKITNPNDPIPDMYLDIDHSEEGFTFVSFSKSGAFIEPGSTNPPVRITIDDVGGIPSSPLVSIAGDANGDTGFTLPSGVSYITLVLKAADSVDDLPDELDSEEEVIGKEPLIVMYSFSSEAEDPCVLESMSKMDGETLIPYGKKITHIKTNRNKTIKIRK